MADGLNERVFAWGKAQGLDSFGEAEQALTDGLTQDDVAEIGDDGSYNAGLLELASQFTFGTSTGAAQTVHDWFGHGTDDLLVFTAATGVWELFCPLTGESETFVYNPHSSASMIPVWGKFDGVRTQVGSFLDGSWRIKDHDALTYTTVFYGLAGDVPLSGFDFDGDGTDNVAVARPSWGWYDPDLPGGVVFYGGTGDFIVPGPWNVAGTDVPAVWSPSSSYMWYAYPGPGDALGVWGGAGDIPVPGDWDGDGTYERAVFRPSNSTWYLDGVASPGNIFVFGTATCTPLVGDWFGTGTLPAVWESGVFEIYLR